MRNSLINSRRVARTPALCESGVAPAIRSRHLISTVNGTWENPANWSTWKVPTASDDVDNHPVFQSSGLPLPPPLMPAIVLLRQHPLMITGSLNVASPRPPSAACCFAAKRQAGMTQAVLNVGGSFTIAGGTLSGGGNVIITDSLGLANPVRRSAREAHTLSLPPLRSPSPPPPCTSQRHAHAGQFPAPPWIGTTPAKSTPAPGAAINNYNHLQHHQLRHLRQRYYGMASRHPSITSAPSPNPGMLPAARNSSPIP